MPVFSEAGGQPLAQREDRGPGVESPLRRVRGERVRSSKGLLEVRVRVERSHGMMACLPPRAAVQGQLREWKGGVNRAGVLQVRDTGR